MIVAQRISQTRRMVLSAVAAVALAAGLLIGASATAQAATQEPCDIFASAGTPCVAAHSTVRALFSAYNGPLYQVQRSSDSAETNIGVLSAGGVANAATQDSFCAGTTCTITRIYDQTSRHNDLTIEGAGGNGGADRGAIATSLPITVGGHKAYGVFISPGMGYRNDATSGVARNGQPEDTYMVTSGTHVNSGCCFDYGNAETNNRDNGNAHMDAVNFGTECWFTCNGAGPWVQADLENGLFQSGAGGSQNTSNTGVKSTFVTALLKNNGQNQFALKAANAASGGLTTEYSGPEPSGYSPMKQEGAIVLGTGGDDSNSSAGSFFEGVMTAGFPSDTTDNAVQANIVAAGYHTPTTAVGPTAGQRISLQATTACCTSDYIQHSSTDDTVSIAQVTSSSSATVKADSTWITTAGLANSSCVSFESANESGQFLRHFNFQLLLQPNDNSSQFAQDATFCPQPGNTGQGVSFQSVNFTDKDIRHFDFTVYIASDGGSNAWDTSTLWPDDTTWLVASPWA